jgi:hypothetical protein
LTTGGVFSVFRKMRNGDASNGESGLQLVNTVNKINVQLLSFLRIPHKILFLKLF